MTRTIRRSRSIRSIGLLAVGCLTLAVVALFMLRPIRVVGQSMEPALHDGDVVLVWSGPGWKRLVAVGSIVVAAAPDPGHVGVRTVVKRVAGREQAAATARWKLIGDNPAASRDSRQYGAIAESQIEGIVVFRIYSRPGSVVAAGSDPPRRGD